MSLSKISATSPQLFTVLLKNSSTHGETSTPKLFSLTRTDLTYNRDEKVSLQRKESNRYKINGKKKTVLFNIFQTKLNV